MAKLKIINNLEMSTQGRTVTAKQGAATEGAGTAFSQTVTGTTHERVGTLAITTYSLIYDASVDFPPTFNHGFFWADQDCQINLVTSATGVTFDVTAYVPFSFPGKILGQSTNANLAAQATTTAIDEITIGHEVTGITMNYVLVIVD